MAKCVQCGRSLPAFSFGKKICQWCVQYEAAQRGEVVADAIQPVMQAPWVRRANPFTVTHAIFGINVAVFVGMALAGVSPTDPTSHELIHWGANSARLTLAGEWWRLLTSMFLHIGIIHIALNMWCLWSLGAMCESLYGALTFGAVYLISGVGGSLASVAWHPYGVSAGASGAIFGLAGALIGSYSLGEFSLPRAAVAANLRCVFAFAVYNLIFGAISGRTDNAAHVGGLATGIVLGALIARIAPQSEGVARRVAVIMLGAALVAAAGLWLERTRGVEARVMKANELLMTNQRAQAVAELQAILRQRPEYALAHFSLAHAYFNLQQYQQAESELKRVLDLEPQNRLARYELGMTYLNQKRIDQAKTFFEDALTRNPNDADAHFGLASALEQEQDYAGAIDQFSAAAKLDPESEGAYYEMGVLYAKLKKYDEAIAAYLKEKQQNGDDEYIESGLAEAYEAKGLKSESEEARKKSAQLKAQAGD